MSFIDYSATIRNEVYPVNFAQLNDAAFHVCGQYDGLLPAGEFGWVTCSHSPICGRYVYIILPEDDRLVSCEVRIFGSIII